MGPHAPSPVGPRAELAQQVALAVDRLPGIERSQSLVSSTLYPGGRVEGVVLGNDEVQVHIKVGPRHFGQSLYLVADPVHAAVHGVLVAAGDGRRVRVAIEDLGSGRPAGVEDD